MTVSIKYCGVDIDFIEHLEKWRIEQEEYPTLKAAKDRIDRLLKDSAKLPDTPVIVIPSWRSDNRREALATRWEGESVWIVSKDRSKRSKERADNIILDTPEARAALKQYDALKADVTALLEKAETLLQSIPRIKR